MFPAFLFSSSNLLEVESFQGRIDARKLFVFDAFAIDGKAGTVVRHKHGDLGICLCGM